MNLKPFLSWCSAQGIVSPLQVRERDGFRYTVLTDDIDRTTDTTSVIHAPLTACITASSHEALADRLLHEKSLGNDSKFAPYLATLPELDSYQSSMPRFWSNERLETVTDGGILWQEVEADRDRLQGRDPWAVACVDSRCNLLADKSYALTPFLDLMNHDGAVSTTAQVKEDGTLVLDVATASIPLLQPAAAVEEPTSSFLGGLFGKQQRQPASIVAEPEVFISYGDLTNLQTLLNYGFVRTDNPCNTELLSVQLMGQPAPIIAEISSTSTNTSGRSLVDPVALGALRRLLATTQELELAASSNAAPSSDTFSMVPFLSERNEIETFAVLAGFLEEAVYEANRGADNAADNDDLLVSRYLKGRAATLQTALDRIESKYPQVFG